VSEVSNINDGTLNVRAGSLGGTSMRYHELALVYWLNHWAYVRESYAVPVVMSSPMDAFSAFQQLWADENNPFAYLFNLKDANGTPLYEPYPSPVRYPVISVYRKGWKYRQYQNFSIHRWRHINWPTVANAGTERYGAEAQGWGVTKCKLGNVTTSRMPMAWDYRFQIDHFCNRPDTQAFFIEQLMQEFWRTGGTVPQTWVTVPYPGWGNRRVRLYLDGDIESLTPEEPEEGKNVEFRTSFTVVLEGFDVDLRYEIYPALWNVIFRFGPVAPIELDAAFNFTGTVDTRINGSNSSIDLRPNVPSWGTCQHDLTDTDVTTAVQMIGYNGSSTVYFGTFTVGSSLNVYAQNGQLSTSFVSGTVMQDIITINSGTDYAVLAASLGNIGEYSLANNINVAVNSVAAFGTHFEALVHAGTYGPEVASNAVTTFGTYTPVVVSGTVSDSAVDTVSVFGSYTLTVFTADTGTESGTNAISAFGTYLLVSESAGTHSDGLGSISVSVFGTYISS
jgi:hypothetical protein